MKSRIGIAAFVGSTMFVAQALATNCTAKFKDCNGIEQTAEWPCVACVSGTEFGRCNPVPLWEKPGDPDSCIIGISPLCAQCVNP